MNEELIKEGPDFKITKTDGEYTLFSLDDVGGSWPVLKFKDAKTAYKYYVAEFQKNDSEPIEV